MRACVRACLVVLSTAIFPSWGSLRSQCITCTIDTPCSCHAYHDAERAPTSVHKIDIAKGTQKEAWFVHQLNPNGRIPVIVDRSRDNFVVFETAAILLYLQQFYDKDNKFGFNKESDPNTYSETLQWMFFAVSSLPRKGPIQVF